MSMWRELNGAIIATQRRLDDQISKLRSFEQQIDTVTSQVDSVLDGDEVDGVPEMKTQLSQTKQQVQETLRNLQTAKDKLGQVARR